MLFFSRPQPITLQALNDEDRKQWLCAMDGKEPVRFKKVQQL